MPGLLRALPLCTHGPRLGATLCRELIQYDDRSEAVATNLRFAWLQSASSGLYVVYNELNQDDLLRNRETRKEFIIKYSYIFDLL